MQAKLDKLKPDDPQRDEVIASFAHDVWLASAAKRVEQIQAVTHSPQTHPPLTRRGTNLYVEPPHPAPIGRVGQPRIGERLCGRCSGNAAALDAYKMLKLEVNGAALLTALLAQDADTLAALHTDPAQAGAARCLVSFTQPAPKAQQSHAGQAALLAHWH